MHSSNGGSTEVYLKPDGGNSSILGIYAIASLWLILWGFVGGEQAFFFLFCRQRNCVQMLDPGVLGKSVFGPGSFISIGLTL